jgi:hypothetical protein
LSRKLKVKELSTIGTKPKVADPTDNFDDSHKYKCLKCGAEHENPVGKFYKSQYSELYLKNDRFSSLCTTCVKELFNSYEKKYETKTACILMCHKLDIPFYHSLFDSIVKSNTSFSMGLYLRQINGKQYQYKSFNQSILEGELSKTDVDVRDEKEVKWTSSEIQNKLDAIALVGYDPFEGYNEVDRRFLFNELVKYFDEDIAEDTYKLSQVIQIVNNNNQVRQCDVIISSLNPIRDSNDIKNLNSIKKDLVASNDKMAKENEISVKNRSNKDVGKSTLTYLMRDLREKDFEKAEADYYNQLKGEGTFWSIEMSNKAILQNGMFDENDKKEVYETQFKLIQDLQNQVDDLLEKNRLLHIKNGELQKQIVGEFDEEA